MSARAANPTRSRPRPKKKTDHMLRDEIVQHGGVDSATAQVGSERVFNPTFTSSKHERAWILVRYKYARGIRRRLTRLLKTGRPT